MNHNDDICTQFESPTVTGFLIPTVAQILRYLEAIAPGLSMLALLQESDPSLKTLEQLEATQRVRPLSATELQKLDF